VVVTQNVDGFHQQAGSRDVIELHGNILRSVCSITRRVIDDAWLARQPQRPPPSPHHRNGLARPDVVWFGEALPETALTRALELAATADVFLSVGTSSLVQPAAGLPLVARDSGACVVEINPAETPLSVDADVRLRAPARDALSLLVSKLWAD
jgi:NAD-dependent deacetylase